MSIQEYQVKTLLRKFGEPIPDGHVRYNVAAWTASRFEYYQKLAALKYGGEV